MPSDERSVDSELYAMSGSLKVKLVIELNEEERLAYLRENNKLPYVEFEPEPLYTMKWGTKTNINVGKFLDDDGGGKIPKGSVSCLGLDGIIRLSISKKKNVIRIPKKGTLPVHEGIH